MVECEARGGEGYPCVDDGGGGPGEDEAEDGSYGPGEGWVEDEARFSGVVCGSVGAVGMDVAVCELLGGFHPA